MRGLFSTFGRTRKNGVGYSLYFVPFKTYLTGSKGALWVPSILSLQEKNYFLDLEKLQYPKTLALTLLAAERFIKICVIVITIFFSHRIVP